ncbi:hypothetical protein B0O99DRAFT_631984 [Bisporella sp. PMI_857]|nr:hypothetical protein B0O99DRAFT_631984 [Bisporella sp. PMI_857]
MNVFWPTAPRRLFAIQPRVIVQTCHNFDSLAASVAQRSISSLCTRQRSQWSARERPISRSCFYTSPFRQLALRFRSRNTKSPILTRFEQLLVDKEYLDDEEEISLPFRYHAAERGVFQEKPLTEAEKLAVFGEGISVGDANDLLRRAHGHRVAGTLPDPEDTPDANSPDAYTEKTYLNALTWLRKHVPVDEIRNATLRAEHDLEKYNQQIIEDSERIGIYKPNSGEQAAGKKGKKDKSVYGDSGLDYIRNLNKKKREVEEAESKEREGQAAEIRQVTGEVDPEAGKGLFKLTAPWKGELANREPSPFVKKWTENAKSQYEKPPELTMFRRLFPSTLLVLTVVGLCSVFTVIYTPPRNKDRLFPDVPPAAATILGIITVNVGIFLAWRFPPFWRIGNKYFISTPGVPVPWSLLGNIFSHQSFSHLCINMFVLYLIGTRLHDEVGRATFLSVYVSSGALGSLASLASFVLRSSFVSASLGASGAISGVVGAYLWLKKDEPVRAFFIPEGIQIPSWVPLGIILALEIFPIAFSKGRLIKVDHWAHLGGYMSGIGAAEHLRRKARQRGKLEAERRRNMGILDKIKEGRL